MQSGCRHDGLDGECPAIVAPKTNKRVGLGPQEVDTRRDGDRRQRRVAVDLQFLPRGTRYDLGPFSTSAATAGRRPGAFWSIMAILLGVVLAAHVIVEKLAGVDLPERLGSIGWGVMHLAGGALAFIFVIIKAINPATASTARSGFYLGLLARARSPRRRLPDGEGSRRAADSSSAARVAERRHRLRRSRTHRSLDAGLILVMRPVSRAGSVHSGGGEHERQSRKPSTARRRPRLGWRAERRPPPGFAHVLGAAAGAWVVVAIVAFIVEVSSDDPTAPGVAFSAGLAIVAPRGGLRRARADPFRVRHRDRAVGAARLVLRGHPQRPHAAATSGSSTS